MASAIISSTILLLLPSRLRTSRTFVFIPHCTTTSPIFKRCRFAPKFRSSSTSFVQTQPEEPLAIEEEEEELSATKNDILACPICYQPLFSSLNSSGASFQCGSCQKTYSGKESHVELTVASGATNYEDTMPLATEFFRTPLISFLYERGWRQNFVWGGFPGPEKEFELMKDYLKPVLGGNIIDASCGSGLFSRLFAKSGLFSLVVALDYSENMLKQCYDFIKQEENFPKEKLILVRADISRLPFVSGSVDAVHAGAAIHCWPSPPAAVAEISRVLRPGGVFVGTTFILDWPFGYNPLLGPFRQNLMQLSGSQVFLKERELEEICRACGLVGFTATRNRQFIMFSARRPN
ncbi:S-adenosyl-L-methionine-dependent methyltransferases superfamily protein [Euphorbia peplus]|nr:S-adenosyl-L-methionine-dependent methyltransferases superfamily protein [Euphorbia peplus]